MPIKGLSEKRRLPRAGRIKLGILVQEPGKKPYPRAVDYFVCPDAVIKAVSQDKPRELPIVFPVDDPAVLFPQSLKMYKTAGLWCAGDGERAKRWNDAGNLEERGCPCEFLEEQPDGKPAPCKPLATLNFFIPAVAGVGVYQISTSSKASIISLNSGLEMFGRMFGGLRGIPFLLKLEPQQTERWDEQKKQMVKTTVQVMRLDSERTLREITEWRQQVADVPALLMPEAEAIPDPVQRAAETSGVEQDPERQRLLDEVWTCFFDAAGQDATKAATLSIKSVKKILDLNVAGLADLTLAQIKELSEKVYR